MIASTTLNDSNGQTIIGSNGFTQGQMVTFTTIIEQYDTSIIQDKIELEKKVKSIKKDLKYATGLRKKGLQQELQTIQRELKLLK